MFAVQDQSLLTSPSFGFGHFESCSLRPVPCPCFLCSSLGGTEEPLAANARRTTLRGSDLAAGPRGCDSLQCSQALCAFATFLLDKQLFQCQQDLTELLPWQKEKNISVRQLHYITKVIWRHRYSESPLCSFLFPGTISLFSF